ncbi:uncharacterized protein LOC123683154 [Harmonia axyridis]|uniref:uncharacterized protein LOC123683154 n=1 Tax=Harmonia axyridis TaxID=115357 RepID=UPI001E275953|nr:uncharacterized protein LOC123683154 [Harmonia axyridis]
MPLSHLPDSSMLLLNCLNQVITPFLANSTNFVVVNSDLKFSVPITLYALDQEEIPFSLQQPEVYLVDVRKKELNDSLMHLEKRTCFNPRAIFVIITEKIKADLYDIFDWYFIRSSIILKVSMDQIRVYSRLIKGRRRNETVIDKSSTMCKEEELKSSQRQKLSKENTLPLIKVGASYNVPSVILTDGVPDSGIDLDILNIMSKKLNFKTEVIVVEAFAGKKSREDFSFNGALGNLQRREVPFLIGGIYPTRQGSISFDFTQGTSVDRYAYIVPVAKVRPFWKRLIYTFSLTVWMLFLVVFVVILVTLSLINRTIMKGYYSWDKELLKLYSMCFTSVQVKMSETKSKKTLYTSWYFFLLIFSNHFTAKLLSKLVVKKFEHQIHKPEELKEVDWKICIFSDLDKDKMLGLHKGVMSCTNCETCTNKTAYEGNVVSIRSEKLTQYEIGKFYFNEDREPLVFIMNQYYLVTHNVIVFRKNHPLFGRFNKMLGYLLQSGIYERMCMKYNPLGFDRYQKNRWMSLKLEQLSFIFKFLTYGWFLSTLVFVCKLLAKVFLKKEK